MDTNDIIEMYAHDLVQSIEKRIAESHEKVLMRYEIAAMRDQWIHKNTVWEFVGSGYFSTVFDLCDNSDRVIRISFNKKDSEDTDAYDDFAEFVMANPLSNFPKIDYHEIIESETRRYSFTVLEKLENYREALYKKQVLKVKDICGSYHSHPDELSSNMRSSGLIDLADAIDVIASEFKKNEWHWDLHGGNILFRRSDTTFVIIDPLFSKNKEYVYDAASEELAAKRLEAA